MKFGAPPSYEIVLENERGCAALRIFHDRLEIAEVDGYRDHDGAFTTTSVTSTYSMKLPPVILVMLLNLFCRVLVARETLGVMPQEGKS